MFVFAAGIGVGLLVAPMTGQQARDKLRKLVEERLSGGSTDVAEKIRYELSHSPRTWHLPQPTVAFVHGPALLRGAVPHATGRAYRESAADAGAGVKAGEQDRQN